MKNKTKFSKYIILILLYLGVFAYYFSSRYFITNMHNIHCFLDDKIPFLPIFIIPYILWYLYISIPLFYILITNKSFFLKQMQTIVIGLYICVIIFVLYPSYIEFRPTAEGNGILLFLCRWIYKNDTPSMNVLPSLHCYLAILMHCSTFINTPYSKYKFLRISSFIYVCFVCMSTVFVKQHSVIDVIIACPLAIIYFITYKIISTRLEKKNGSYNQTF